MIPFSLYTPTVIAVVCVFLDYLIDEGINETIFDRIKGNVARGKCEHVDGALSQYVHKTSVIGQHTVAASGVLPSEHCECETKIFRLYPYMIAVLKKHSQVVEKYIQHRYDEADELYGNDNIITGLLYASRIKENPEFIEVRTKKITELCASQEDPLLFKILDPEHLEDFDQ